MFPLAYSCHLNVQCPSCNQFFFEIDTHFKQSSLFHLIEWTLFELLAYDICFNSLRLTVVRLYRLL